MLGGEVRGQVGGECRTLNSTAVPAFLLKSRGILRPRTCEQSGEELILAQLLRYRAWQFQPPRVIVCMRNAKPHPGASNGVKVLRPVCLAVLVETSVN